jgi:hypothetical protein
MREHPLPQDITSYRFHIIGNMTIKQFAQMGAGCMLAFLIYTTNLLDIIKWPLIALSVGMGAMVAFVPFEERPLDHWISTFIKILYKPTKFYWKKEAKIPEAFLYTPQANTTPAEEEFDLSQVRRERIREYLSSVNRRGYHLEQDQIDEQTRITGLMQTFAQIKTTAPKPTESEVKPDLKVRVRGLGQSNQAHYYWVDANSEKYNQENQTKLNFNQILGTPILGTPILGTPIDFRTPLATAQVAQNIQVPEQTTVRIAQEAEQTDGVINTLSINPNTQSQSYVDNATIPQEEAPELSVAVTYNSQLPFPTPPTEPNIVVGMVLTPQHDLVNDAIVEVKNEEGSTIRAVKTNALGQFFISTPLPVGNYFIVTEKENMTFTPIQLPINNTVVHPVEIRSNE